jgi:hypothetical protein
VIVALNETYSVQMNAEHLLNPAATFVTLLFDHLYRKYDDHLMIMARDDISTNPTFYITVYFNRHETLGALNSSFRNTSAMSNRKSRNHLTTWYDSLDHYVGLSPTEAPPGFLRFVDVGMKKEAADLAVRGMPIHFCNNDR